MKTKSQKDFVSGLALIIVGLAFSIGSTNYSFGSNVSPGSGYFPFGLGIILAILGLIVFVSSFYKKTSDGERIGRFPWRSILCVCGALLFFGLFLHKLGFLISFPVTIILTAFASTEFKWQDALLNAVVLTTLSYLVFIAGLQLNIPVWPIWLN